MDGFPQPLQVLTTASTDLTLLFSFLSTHEGVTPLIEEDEEVAIVDKEGVSVAGVCVCMHACSVDLLVHSCCEVL